MTRKCSFLTRCLTLLAAGCFLPAAYAQDHAPALLNHGLQPIPQPAAAACPNCQAGQPCAADCGCQRCLRCRLAVARQHMQAAALSGQPLIDPWARADWIAQQKTASKSWHGGYYNTQYGAPVALMVPPTARMQTSYGWGVSQTTMSPIYPQFQRPYPGPVMVDPSTGMGPAQLLPTPRWPSHTDQFGVYYVRSPW